MFKFKLGLRIFSFFYIVCQSYESKAQSTESDKRLDNLLKHGERLFTRAYIELPEPADFLSMDMVNSRPCKLVNYSDHLSSVFNDWSVDEISKNPLSSLVFGNLSQAIKGDLLVSDTNLRRFLNQIDEYDYETYADFRMPSFIRYLNNLNQKKLFKLLNLIYSEKS